MDYNQALGKLKEYNQEHLLKFYEKMPKEKQEKLLAQIEKLDLEQIKKLYEDIKKPEEKKEKWADQFAGAWKDNRSAEEIIADIRNARTSNREIEL